jgi:glycosyltransferase involved in cell wall biosynthesis
MNDFPLISAIMLVGRVHKNVIAGAVKCFKSQTYPNKELIIVNNARTQYEAAGLNIIAQDDVFIIDTPAQLSAGMARNYGIQAANGQILAQFDADYWHHPERLSTQVASLAINEAQICMLSSVAKHSFYTGNSGIYSNNKEVILGTMVFIRPREIDYNDQDKNEEFSILEKMIRNNHKPINISDSELCCKLFIGNEPSNIKDYEQYMSTRSAVENARNKQ